ncbi:MAG: IS4 family transposase, partial [Leptolyngbyaceae cyanobacterium]
MLPASYQKTPRAHLSESQDFTLQLPLLLLPGHRQVKLATLPRCFPPPI